MTPTWRPLAHRLALFINRHPDAIAAAAGLFLVLVGAIAAMELLPAFRLV